MEEYGNNEIFGVDRKQIMMMMMMIMIKIQGKGTACEPDEYIE